MTAEDKQVLRRAILVILDAMPASIAGMNIDNLTLKVSAKGFDMITAAEVEMAMGLLVEKKMVVSAPNILTPGVRLWRKRSDVLYLRPFLFFALPGGVAG